MTDAKHSTPLDLHCSGDNRALMGAGSWAAITNEDSYPIALDFEGTRTATPNEVATASASAIHPSDVSSKRSPPSVSRWLQSIPETDPWSPVKVVTDKLIDPESTQSKTTTPSSCMMTSDLARAPIGHFKT